MEIVLRHLLWWVTETILFYWIALAIARALPMTSARARLRYWQAALLGIFLAPAFGALVVRTADARMPVRSFRFAALVSSAGRPTLPYPGAIATLLIAGAMLHLVYILAGALRLRAIRRCAVAWLSDLASVELMQGTAAVQVLISADIAVPATHGWRRPAILVPLSWPGLQPAVRLAVLAHEMAHIRRADWLAHISEELMAAAIWFHPAIRPLLRRVRLAREQVVDAAAIRATHAPQDYLQALVAFAVRNRAYFPAPCFTAAAQLKQRIESIQKESTMNRRINIRNLFPAFALLAGAAFLVAWSTPLRSAIVAQHDPQNGEVYRVGDGVKPPELLSKVEPGYSKRAKDAKIQGVVVVQMILGRDGIPLTVQVTKSLDPDLDQHARDAIRQWRFNPATLQGEAVAVQTTIEVHFRLL